jgi:hypothetical protein
MTYFLESSIASHFQTCQRQQYLLSSKTIHLKCILSYNLYSKLFWRKITLLNDKTLWPLYHNGNIGLNLFDFPQLQIVQRYPALSLGI